MRTTIVILGILAVGLTGCEADLVSPENKAPVVESISIGLTDVFTGDACPVICVASDPDGDRLTYEWRVISGSATGRGSEIIYTPVACCLGGNPVVVTVRDGRGGETEAEIAIPVRQ